MEHTPFVSVASKTTPKDFFLWLGAIIALYGSITSIVALLFEYINYSYPDALAGNGDPYGGAVRFSMATLIVLVPTMIVIFRILRTSIVKEAGKATIWVRRWALVLTLFIATAAMLIDLVTLINTFLGGEVTIRFGLKVAVVLLVAFGVFLHFLADIKGYWIERVAKGNMIGMGVGVLVLVTIIAGFFIIGTPGHVRNLKLDSDKVAGLQNIQYQIVNYYQQKRALPPTLDALNDPLSGATVQIDTQTKTPYEYGVTGALSFKLCATFNTDFTDMRGKGAFNSGPSYPIPTGMYGISDTWKHEAGRTCYERTIDPVKYPPISPPVGKPL